MRLLLGQLASAVGQSLASGGQGSPLGLERGLARDDLFQRLIVAGRQGRHLGQPVAQAADFVHQSFRSSAAAGGARRFCLAIGPIGLPVDCIVVRRLVAGAS